jgi:predicted Fe-Mo cluster-binding NifX family protein
MPTVGNNGLTEMVFDHFGSAPFFTIYNTETKAIDVLSNNNQHHNHGTCQPVSVISNQNIDAILTNGMGRRAVQMLNDSGIRVYLLQGNTVKEAVDLFESKSLTELTLENACGGHGHGHGCH